MSLIFMRLKCKPSQVKYVQIQTPNVPFLINLKICYAFAPTVFLNIQQGKLSLSLNLSRGEEQRCVQRLQCVKVWRYIMTQATYTVYCYSNNSKRISLTFFFKYKDVSFIIFILFNAYRGKKESSERQCYNALYAYDVKQVHIPVLYSKYTENYYMGNI